MVNGREKTRTKDEVEDIRDVFYRYLLKEDRNIKWFCKKVNHELTTQNLPNVSYSSIYYTFKKVHDLDDKKRELWNKVLGTSF